MTSAANAGIWQTARRRLAIVWPAQSLLVLPVARDQCLFGWFPWKEGFNAGAIQWLLRDRPLPSSSLETGCGVTGEPLTGYCPWATAQTRWSKLRCEVGPKLKCWITALNTLGWVLGSPYLWDSISSFWAIFWCRKLKTSTSSGVINLWADAMLKRESTRTTRGYVITPWGGGMLGKFQQNSRILILCIYSLSNVYIYLL